MDDERDLQLLYQWVDELPLSRPKRNIARDFADGVLVAEIVKHFFPRLVELHNYSPAHGVDQKLYNWRTLNTKVFAKLSFELSSSDMNDIVRAVPGSIERFLFALQERINVIQQKMEHQTSSTASETAERSVSAIAQTGGHGVNRQTGSGSIQPPPSRGKDRGTTYLSEALEDKDRLIFELQEKIQIMTEKLHRMEDIIVVKDNKIQALQEALQNRHGSRR